MRKTTSKTTQAKARKEREKAKSRKDFENTIGGRMLRKPPSKTKMKIPKGY